MAKMHYAAIALLAIAAFVVQLLLMGVNVSVEWARAVSASFAIVGTGILAFDRLIWRAGWLYGTFHHRPNLRGEWDVTIQSNFDDGSGQPVVRTGTMRVDQTFFDLDIFLETAESDGHVVAREFVRLGKNTPRLVAIYQNEPRANVRDQSPIHYGTMMLDFDEPYRRPERLRGSYWTHRGTTGQIEATRRTD